MEGEIGAVEGMPLSRPTWQHPDNITAGHGGGMVSGIEWKAPFNIWTTRLPNWVCQACTCLGWMVDGQGGGG